jgi:hypothetical protein
MFPGNRTIGERMKVPYFYEDLFKIIWMYAGSGIFIWNFIREHTTRTQHTLRELSDNGWIIDCGVLISTGNIKKWCLSPEIVRACFEKFGPGANGIASELIIKNIEFSVLKSQSQINTKWYNRMIGDTIPKIVKVFGYSLWSISSIRVAGIRMSRSDLEKLYRLGFVKQCGKSVWMVVEREISMQVRTD